MHTSASENPVDVAIARFAFRSNLQMRLRNEAMGNNAKPFRVYEKSIAEIQEKIYQSTLAQFKILKMWKPELTKVSHALDTEWMENQAIGYGGMTFAEFLVRAGLKEEYEKHHEFTTKYLGFNT